MTNTLQTPAIVRATSLSLPAPLAAPVFEYRLMRDAGASGLGYPNDDTAAFNKWWQYLNANGGRGIAEVGRFYLPGLSSTGAIFVSGGVKIEGANNPSMGFGRGTIFELTNSPLMSIDQGDAVQVESLAVVYVNPANGEPATAAPGVGGCIVVDAPASTPFQCNVGSTFRDITILGADQGLAINNAGLFLLDNVQVFNPGRAGAVIQNISNPGDGDCTIGEGCVFSGCPVAQLYIISGGGLKVGNIKTNGGNYAVIVNYTGAQTDQGLAPMVFSGGSYDGAALCGFLFQKDGNTETAGAFALDGAVVVGGLSVQDDGTGVPWVGTFSITGGAYFAPPPAAPGQGTACISLNGVKDARINPGTLYSSYLPAVGVVVGPTCQNIAVDPNICYGPGVSRGGF